jgi:5-methylcytosine-specific restriction endonuclease McrA
VAPSSPPAPGARSASHPAPAAGVCKLRAAYVIGRACAICGRPAEHLDHVTPLIRGGGSDHSTNLQPLCADCNLVKSDR